jgi:hypothetical protein
MLEGGAPSRGGRKREGLEAKSSKLSRCVGAAPNLNKVTKVTGGADVAAPRT